MNIGQFGNEDLSPKNKQQQTNNKKEPKQTNK